MKILLIGDFHGKKLRIKNQKFDAIFSQGDFCHSGIITSIMFKCMRRRSKDNSFKKKWFEEIGLRKANKLFKISLKKGREILKYLDSFKIPVYIIPGNWEWVRRTDFTRAHPFKNLIKNLKNTKNAEKKLINIGEYQIIGYGVNSSPEYPQYKEDFSRFSKPELKKRKKEYIKNYAQISKLFKKAKKPVIFMSHNVPFNTKLDKIMWKKSPKYGYHYGSLVTKKIIEKYQPFLCICGHMHEHQGKTKIGKTLVINPGYAFEGQYAILELKGKKIKSLRFYK